MQQYSWSRDQLPIVRSTAGETPEAKKQRKGAYAWMVIHTYPIENRNSWNPFNAQRFFFHVFWNLVPKEGCSCSEFFVTYCNTNPPDFSSAEAFFLWSFGLHNAVNAKIGKPILTYSDACKLWGWPLTVDNHPA
jgi:hypothetical protein